MSKNDYFLKKQVREFFSGKQRSLFPKCFVRANFVRFALLLEN